MWHENHENLSSLRTCLDWAVLSVLVCREMFRVPVVKEQLKKPLGLEQEWGEVIPHRAYRACGRSVNGPQRAAVHSTTCLIHGM